jgi:hypothetical protein
MIKAYWKEITAFVVGLAAVLMYLKYQDRKMLKETEKKRQEMSAAIIAALIKTAITPGNAIPTGGVLSPTAPVTGGVMPPATSVPSGGGGKVIGRVAPIPAQINKGVTAG